MSESHRWREVSCPRCGAGEGERCVSLDGRQRPLASSHLERNARVREVRR